MGKKLIAYFSASGTTAKIAQKLAKASNSDLYEIKAETPYTNADLNWMDKKSRSSVEMNNRTSRPKLADTDANIDAYDTIFIGFPIWWYIAPTIINSFLEAYDFSNKKIVLFATSGGSDFGKAVDNLKLSVSNTTEIVEGKIFNGNYTNEELKKFFENI